MTAVNPEASRQVMVEAALVLLERMGLTPADLAAVPQSRPRMPTFAEYMPLVSAAVSTGTPGRTSSRSRCPTADAPRRAPRACAGPDRRTA